jgi:hypothetical protein
MIDRINGRLALLLAVLGVLLLVLLGWYALVSPQRSKAATLDGQVSQTQAQLAATHAFLRSGSGPKSVAELRRLRVAVPDDVMMSTILRQLSWAAGRTGVRIDSVTPSPAVASGGGQAVPIGLSVQGHYFHLAKFMHLLRRMANVTGGRVHASGRLYAVDGIQFSSGERGGPITATIALDAFVHGAAPAPAVAPGTTPTTALQTTTP